MKLYTEILPRYFTIGTPVNSHYTEPTNCLDFVDRKSGTLLVTIGDSWTWGSELSDRLNQVWGNQVSDFFAWDWLNLSLPGGSNFFIADWAEELANIADYLEYESIVVICLFTEIGRGFNSHHDRHIDYRRWLANNCHRPQDFYKFLEMINSDCANRILLASHNKFKIFFASNFVDHLGLPGPLTLPIPWLRLLGLNSEKCVYAANDGVRKLQEIKEFLSAKKIHMYKSWISDMIDDAELITNIRGQCAQGRTIAHPDHLGHTIWSDYVITYLKSYETKQ